MMKRYDACGAFLQFWMIVQTRLMFEEEFDGTPLMDWSNVLIKSHPFQFGRFQSWLMLIEEEYDHLQVLKQFLVQCRWATDSTIPKDKLVIQIEGSDEIKDIVNLQEH